MRLWFGFLKFWSLFFILLSVASCASVSGGQLHSFEFNARKDSPDILVIAYKYGSGPFALLDENEEAAFKRGADFPHQSISVGGYIPRGEVLYVKWKIKSTGEIFQDTVDLRHRLPKKMTDHMIYFQINGMQLVVYLVTPNRRLATELPVGPSKTNYLKTYVIYPGIPDFSK